MNTKENWLIAWSAIRAKTRIDHFQWSPGIPEEVKNFLPIAKKCKNADSDMLGETSLCEITLKERLDNFLEQKGFQKEWTGWKYTWVKIEESDVDF